MSRVLFISDLHLGHSKILYFEPERGGTTTDEHDQWIVDQWNSVVTKRDVVWVLGDIAFKKDKLPLLAQMRGQKHLVMGNHDTFPLDEYLKYFRVIRPSPWPYKRFWLSHCPIHPTELRGRPNIHGHVHRRSLHDRHSYVNVCVEACNGKPMLLQDIQERCGMEVTRS